MEVDSIMFLSIIIPFHHCVQYFRACLDSIAGQLDEDCELILVGDGAEKDCIDAAQEYAHRFKNIHLFLQEHAGVSAARNHGFKEAKGRYVWFIDSDDWIGEHAISSLKTAALNSDADLIFFGFCYTGDRIAPYYEFPNLLPNQILTDKTNDLYIPTAVDFYFVSVWKQWLKREKIQEVAFDESLRFAEDYQFCLQCYQKIQTFYYLKTDELIYYYRVHPKSAVHSFTPKMFHDFKSVRLLNERWIEELALDAEGLKLRFALKSLQHCWALVRLAVHDYSFARYRELLDFIYEVARDPFFVRMRECARDHWQTGLEGIFIACSYYPATLNLFALCCCLGWSAKKTLRAVSRVLKLKE